MDEKIIEIDGKEYTEDEIWSIRRYIEHMKCDEEAGEIVDHIMEDEADNDPAFARWIETNSVSLKERISDMIDQRNFYNYAEVSYDPYAETLRDYYEADMAQAKIKED